ncbi:MAG TPA: PKD domain-containing protein [Terriglobales bacterium]|nr:PKD domain-containing protein [Terriglobales bacterium]
MSDARCRIRELLICCGLTCAMLTPGAVRCSARQLTNGALSVTVNSGDGSYQFGPVGADATLRSSVGAMVDHTWLRSGSYPSHVVSESPFNDALGSGKQLTVTCSGLSGSPDLVYVLQLYSEKPYGAIQVRVRNGTGKPASVQAIRSVEAIGGAIVNLGGRSADERILSDSFSEDWPDLVIYDLGGAPDGLHRGVGSQLIYNRQSKQSLFLGALTSDRFLTILRLKAQGKGEDAKIASYTVESTGTTEIQKDLSEAETLKVKSLVSDRIELSLPLNPSEEMSSERVMFATGPDYLGQLRTYGSAIRNLHQARVSSQIPMGWWSWTAYYAAINQGETLANADWLSQHLNSLGYNFFQIDEGYQYARGEFVTANATQFPDGMGFVAHHILKDGLTVGLWTAPFEVSSRAWVYEHHKEWLVHNAKGEPIPLEDVWGQNVDTLYALDTTHPKAQEYLRQTYKKLVQEWGVRFIKLDFMDTTAIEGYFYRPNTTALEAQRIGLQVIRDAVGDQVLLDKDGSPMLNPVGIVDTGRISADTGHSFLRTKTSAPGIAARFYMNGNYFIDDPDAFNITDTYLVEHSREHSSHSLTTAQASIALSAIAGGMYEIGDDLLVLGSEKDRLALAENRDLINMSKAGRASTPVDLMTYEPEDGQPSVFFLRQSPRQSMLTVFNWTEGPRSRTLNLIDLGVHASSTLVATAVLDSSAVLTVEGGAIRIQNQSPQSALVIKLVDTAIAGTTPGITTLIPTQSKAGETIVFSAQADPDGVPAVRYHWDFGDGTVSEGPKVSHCYTRAADFTVHLTVDGPDDAPYEHEFTIGVTGELKPTPQLRANRRFERPADK